MGRRASELSGGAHDNMVGGVTSVTVMISSNKAGGVVIEGAATTRNTVANNRIGVDTTGQAVLTGARAGVVIGGAHHNLIGGAGQGKSDRRKRFSVDQITAGVGNTIAGNWIGLAVDGTTRLGNRDFGILIRGGARDNLIGGTADGARNVIAGNANWATGYGYGINIYDLGTTNNTVQGNFIGVDASGNRPAGYCREGILITGNANGNTIGGVAEAARNVIADNGFSGIALAVAYIVLSCLG